MRILVDFKGVVAEMSRRRVSVWMRKAFYTLADLSSYKILWSLVAIPLLKISNSDIDAQYKADQSIDNSELNYDIFKIPNIIFQTWKSCTSIPDNYRYWMSSIKKYNPNYQHILWDDELNRAFIKKEFSWFIKYYDAYPAEIYRADVIRFFFLFRYRGIYIDMDTECLRSLDEIRSFGGIVLGRMGQDKDFSDSVPNAIMASEPGQIFWLLAISMSTEKINEYLTDTNVVAGPESFTGPGLLKRAVDFYQYHRYEDIKARCQWVIELIGCNNTNHCPLTIDHC